MKKVTWLVLKPICRCGGKRKCSFDVNKDLFGGEDPCGDTNTLEVSYSCGKRGLACEDKSIE